MTLKTLLKNAGVPKIRGLIPSIEKQQMELYKWVHKSLAEQYAKVQELEKLNTGLQNQHQSNLAAIAKFTDQIRAAEVKQGFSDKMVRDQGERIKVLEELVKIKSDRIDNYDQFMAEYKAGVAQLNS